MRYQKAIDIWPLSQLQRAALQPGQWVYAGSRDNLGRFWGVRDTGTVYVAWQGNAQRRGKGGYWQYQNSMRDHVNPHRVRAVLVAA